MRTTLVPLISLFISCFILLLGNGLINVLIPVRMGLDGLNTNTIGMVLSLYFVGMLLGAIYSKNLIRRAAHIRVFAGCVALGAVSILVCSLYSDPVLWGGMRIVLGFCNACAYTAMESWLSDSSTKETRGKVLATYNAVVLSGLFFGQFFMNMASPEGTVLFVFSGILLCAAVIPMVLSRNSGPLISEVSSMSLLALYKISPLGVVSCLASGVIYSAIFNLLPVFAKDYGIVTFQLSLYMGTAILGAFLLQFPVGYLSDRFDRRTVLFVLLFISAVADFAVPVLASQGIFTGVFVGTAITTGIIACTYPLSISEAFDKLRQNQMVAAMGSMILAFSIGGILGPYTASIAMDYYGNAALFYFVALIQLLLGGFVMYRMAVREALPVEEQEHFVMQGASIMASIDLDPRTEYVAHQHALSSEAETAATIAETDPAAAVKMARAIAMANPVLGVEVAAAVATVPGINVLRLYEVMKEAVPDQILGVTRAVVTVRPELAYELISKLAEWYPEQVVSVAAEIGHALPELRIEMARVAVESAPESATEVAEYYAHVLAEERDAMRPADRAEDTGDEAAASIASELWNVAPEQAMNVAVAMVDAMPESAVLIAEEYLASNIGATDEEVLAATESEILVSAERTEEHKEWNQEWSQEWNQTHDQEWTPDYHNTVELVSKLAEAAPEQALDMAVAVVEAVPGSAVEVATELAHSLFDKMSDDTHDAEKQSDEDQETKPQEYEDAVALVQRLSDASPEHAMNVAVAVVEAIPESASEVVDSISKGTESSEGEWINSVDHKPAD
ncbi:MFS transporter [Neptunomonas antarctica]|uniref:Predicted arabinose efflux permease, MFS family n=1 Tax=Neptunomonas antarctica TaxID=619304 RepID=A0A1N7K2R6_9GAMM|nr:MFS transporter [Neptunomonas antarctica]SIS55895.1 Predicted arabinose efflux permease, MFS family [Neptunomonas antarctica]